MRKLIVICAVLVLTAVSVLAESVNLTGEYWFGSLSANVSTNVPWAKHGTVTITGNNWSQQWDDQSGHHTFSSTFTTTTQFDGSINVNLSSGAYNIAWNGDVMIHAGIVLGGGGRGIDIFTRKATNVSDNDFIGEYRFFGHWLGTDDRWDDVGWGTCKFNANGSMAFNSAYSDGSSDSLNSTWTLDNINGIGTVSGITPPIYLGQGGIMTGSRIAPDTQSDLDYTLFIKKTTQTITTADIAGTYQVRFLETGPGGVPYTCGQGTCIMEADGTFTVDAYYSDGENDTFVTTYSVGPGNKIMIGGKMEGVISPDKNLIFAPETDRPKNPEDYDWIGGLFLVRELSRPDLQFGNIPGKKNTKISVNNADGVIVTFSLTGGGYGEIVREGGTDFKQINLYDTTEKSLLTITAPKGKTVNLSSITVDGPLKGIMAKTINLNGDIDISGSLGTLTLNNAEGSISIGPSSNPKAAVTMVFGTVNELFVESDTPIKSITAASWGRGSISAPSIGSITSKSILNVAVDVDGDIGTVKVAGTLFGEWNCMSAKSITASGTEEFFLTVAQLPDAKRMALSTLSVKNTFGLSRITASGNIGTVTAGRFYDSTCFAGITSTKDTDTADGVLDLPNPNTDINPAIPATIKSIKINGIKGQTYGMINSNIAAANILSASIVNPDFYGGKSFGIAADSIKSLKVKGTNWSCSKTLNVPGDVPSVPGSFKINIK